MATPSFRTAMAAVGRQDERKRLNQLVEMTRRGDGGLAIVEGEAGIGKSRLVDDAVAFAATRGVATAVGDTDEFARRRPFAALTSTPLLLVVEDLHWADPATLSKLARLGAVAAAQGLLLVVTMRPVPRPHELDRLLASFRERAAVEIVLGPLDQTDIAQLAQALIHGLPGPLLLRRLEDAGGNPSLTIGLVGAAQAAGLIEHQQAWAELNDDAAMPVVPHDAGLIPSEARDVLSVASVLGASFNVADLALLHRASAVDLARPLGHAVAGGTLEEAGDRLAFRHAVIRSVLYDGIAEPVRAALHREAAETLARAGRPADQIAEHLLLSARSSDPGFVALLRRTAAECAARAPALTVKLLDRALEVLDPTDPDHPLMAVRRAQALFRAGQDADGEMACHELLGSLTDPGTAALARRTLVRSFASRGRAKDARRLAETALEMPGASETDRADLHASMAFASMTMGEFERAVVEGEEAVRLATTADDEVTLAAARTASAHALSVVGRVVEAADRAAAAAATLERERDQPRRPQFGHAIAGSLLIFAGRADEGRALIERGQKLNERIGARSALAAYRVSRGAGKFVTGEWDDAVAELTATAGVDGDGLALPMLSHSVLALISIHRDELDEAHHHIESAHQALAAGVLAHGPERLGLARALLHDAMGNPEAATAELRRTWDAMGEMGATIGQPVLGPELARRLVAAGDTDAAAEVAAAVEDRAAHNPGAPNLVGAARVSAGIVRRDVDAVMEAVAAYESGQQSLDLGLACEDAAILLVEAGTPDDAVAMLDQAGAVYERLGAIRRSARVVALQRRLGLGWNRTGSRRRPKSGWEALTPAERRVVGLVAQRLSNPEIAERLVVSRRTVETHVSHALAKLGFKSRVEIARQAPAFDLMLDGQDVHPTSAPVANWTRAGRSLGRI